MKAGVEVSNKEELLWELVEYRYHLQKMIDTLWKLKALPNKSQLHAMFYEEYREKGYGGHVIRNMYSKAKEIVKSALENNAKNKPKLKRLTAEFDI